MCWPRERPATHAAAGAAARGALIFWFGGFFCGWTGSRCGSGRLTTGVVRHACRRRSGSTRGFNFLFWGLFHTLRSDCTRGFFVWRIPDIRRGDSRDGKQPPRIVSSAPLRCVLRSGASHSLQWEVMPALRQGLCLFRGRLRERECEAELRGTHSQAELGNDIGLMGALLPFVLRVVAGACVGRGSGQPTAAAGGAAARGVRGDWGILLRLDWEPLRERTLDHGSGQTRMPPQERRHEEVFGLGDSFAVGLGAVAGADA